MHRPAFRRGLIALGAIGLLALASFAGSHARAASTTTTTLNNTAWTDLGAGPVMVVATSAQPVFVAISDTAPTVPTGTTGMTGIPLSFDQPPLRNETTSHVWAIAQQAVGFVVVAPIQSASASGAAGGPVAQGAPGVASAPWPFYTPSVSATGSLAASGSTVSIAVADGGTIGLQLSSGWTGGPIVAEGSMDGGATYPIVFNLQPYAGGPAVSSFTAGGNWEASPGGLTNVRVRATAAITGGPVAATLLATRSNKSIRVGAPAANPVNVLDPNNAAFSTAVAMTAGTAYVAARSVGANCTAAGATTLTLAGGGTIALPVAVGWQTFPFAATAYTLSGGAACAVYNLN